MTGEAASWGFLAWAFALGASLGSFYGVCIYRYGNEIPMGGRSFCPSCKHVLRARHLIPIASRIFLKGRCAFCRERIPADTLVVECVSGLVAVLLAARYGPGLAFAATLPLFGALIVLAGIDADCRVLPDAIVIPLIPASLLISVEVLGCAWSTSLLGGLCGAGLLLVLRRVFFAWRGVEGLGLGDVKLMVPLGFLCGLPNVPLLLLAASLSALAVSACCLARFPARPDIRTMQIPFGPFLGLGCLITVLYGDAARIFLMQS